MHLPGEDGQDTRRQVGVEVGVEYVPPGTFKSDKIAFVQNAKMWDYVKITRVPGQTVTCDAVSWALDETNRTYLGGVSWGFSTDSGGTTTLKDPALASAGSPTGVHKAALELWNRQADADEALRNSPGQAKVVVP